MKSTFCQNDLMNLMKILDLGGSGAQGGMIYLFLKLLPWCLHSFIWSEIWMTAVPRSSEATSLGLPSFWQISAFWNWDLRHGRSFTTSSRMSSEVSQDDGRCIATLCDGAWGSPMRPFEAFWDGHNKSGEAAKQLPKKPRDPNHRILRLETFNSPSLFITSWGTRLSWNNGHLGIR